MENTLDFSGKTSPQSDIYSSDSENDGYMCDSELSWVQQYVKERKGHEMLIEVPLDYINNDFNVELLD